MNQEIELACQTGNFELITKEPEYSAYLELCRLGNVNLLQWLYSKYKFDLSYCYSILLRLACSEGHLEIAKWILKNAPSSDLNLDFNKMLSLACNNTDIPKLELILRYSIVDLKWNYIFMVACDNNNLDVIKWLASKINISELSNIYREIKICCISNRIEILIWLFDNYSIFIDNDLFSQIIHLQNTYLIKKIIRNNPLIDSFEIFCNEKLII